MSKSPYTGSQIDEALRKASTMRIVNNGWILLESSEAKPVNLNTLVNPGNYSVNYWTNGPSSRDELGYPASVTVVNIANSLYQFFTIGSTSYNRKSGEGDQDFGAWNINQSAGAMNPGTNAPSAPVDGKTTWLDTTDPNNPTFKLYLNGGWVEIIPAGLMQATVYDPSGRKTDIFAYIDAEIAKLDPALVEMDFSQHINDQTIHVTNEEKEKWNNNATKQDIEDKIHELGPEITSKTEEVIGEDLIKIDQLSNDIRSLEESLNLHTEDTTIHPSLEKQSEWDSKAAGDHQHILDGKVKITVDDIEGEIGDTLIPFTLKERAYIVTSEEERLKLQFNPTHNGDAVCVTNSGSEDKWYFVVDEKYLGQYDPEMRDRVVIQEICKDWSNTKIDVKPHQNIESIYYGNNVYIAIYPNSDGIILYSKDGYNWTSVYTSLDTSHAFAISGGNTDNGFKFVICCGARIAYNGNIFIYSTDGISWTQTSSGISSGNWYDILYTNKLFITIKWSSRITAYSNDGITWTEVTTPSVARQWRKLAFSGNMIVATTDIGGHLLYSTDGVSWTDNEPNIDKEVRWYGITYGANKFVSCGYASPFSICYSEDGITWTNLNLSSEFGELISYDIVYGVSGFLIIELDTLTGKIYLSEDGIEWKIISQVPFFYGLSGCAVFDRYYWSGSKSIYVTENKTIAKFVAGVDWEKKISESLPVRQWSGIAISDDNNTIVAISSDTNSVVYSTDHGSTWNTSDTILSVREWSGIIFANGKFVMVAANSDTFAYSTDGITWTETSDGLINQNWSSLAYGANKFVAIAANSDTFAYSSDGVSWQTTSTGILSDLSYSDVSYSADKFFVCAKNSNTVLYSDDGISWHATNDGISNREWIKTCFGNNRYLLVAANSDTFAYSNNGIRWYETTVGIDGDNINWTDVIFGNGRFVVIGAGNNNRVIYSLDGYYWNESEWESDNKNWRCVIWNGNESTYISLNDGDNNVGISKTYYNEYIKTEAGKDWTKTQKIGDGNNPWTSLGYGKNIYVAIQSGSTFAYSSDGINWTKYSTGLSGDDWFDIAINESKFVITGGATAGTLAITNKFAYSVDGISWTETSVGLDLNNRRSIVWGNDKFVAVSGAGGTGTNTVAYSMDGISWSLATIGVAKPRYHIEFGNGLFITIAGANSNIASYSTDGILWTDSSSGLNNRNWEYGCFDGDKFIFGVIRENILAYSINGIEWTELQINSSDLQIENICHGPGLYVTASRGSSISFYSNSIFDWHQSKLPMNIDNYYSIEFLADKYILAEYGKDSFIYSISDIENFPLPDPYSPPAEKAYRQVLSGASSINWQNVSNTPTTLAGYGITDAASDEDLEKISQEISEVQQNIPSDIDLSNAVEAQTTYNELLTNLSIIDSIFSTLDSTIASLESVVS